MVAVKLENVSKTIKNNKVLRNINLELEAGKIYGFYGRNGSGKSMLFRVIAGLVMPSEGTVTVFGEKIGKDVSFPSSLGIIIENINLWNELSGFDNLKMLAMIKNAISDEQINQTIARVGLDPRDKKRYGKYSLGMRQKLALAQALMEQPRLIILDEPTNGLDESSVDNIRKVLIEERQRGATILIASHNKDDIRILCDQVYKMEMGLCERQEDGWQ